MKKIKTTVLFTELKSDILEECQASLEIDYNVEEAINIAMSHFKSFYKETNTPSKSVTD